MQVLRGEAVNPDWSDPEYRAAKLARAAAYSAFCTGAGANPYMAGTPDWMNFYAANVQPLRMAFMAASEALRVETARVIQESEEA